MILWHGIVWTALTGLNMRTTRKKTSDYLYSLKSAKAAAKNAALSAIFAAASGAAHPQTGSVVLKNKHPRRLGLRGCFYSACVLGKRRVIFVPSPKALCISICA